MSNDTGNPPGPDVASLVNQLCRRARQVVPDDLSGLAQMHGLCEALVNSDGAASPLGERATQIARRLEQLILGECQNSAAALTAIVQELPALAGLATSDTEDPAEPADTDRAARLETNAAAGVAPSAAPGPLSSAVYESTPLTINPKETEFVKSFVDEACEHIESVEAALLAIERTPGDQARIDDLFRPFHTIKGMAGFLNLRDINCLTHEAETLLDQARKGRRMITPGLIDLIFSVADVLKAQVAAVASYLVHPTGGTVPQPAISHVIGQLRAAVADQDQPAGGSPAQGGGSQAPGQTPIAQPAVPREVADASASLRQHALEPPKTLEPVQKELGGAAPAVVSAKAVADQSVRIDTSKLDLLVDMVGELVIAQTLVAGSAATAADAKLGKVAGEVTKIIRTVQEVVLSMRMIPIGSTFQRMARLVRDLARKAGKRVELTISGEDTELDKTVIQQISDPLVHMVRNAVDHGVETLDARRAAGKSEVGRVHLSACHRGGNVVIAIADDGRGLDPERLIAKGIEKGLVAPGAELTDEQANALIFAPGFSTAEQVTDISGRGVGMDVVRRNIERLRGKVEITSQKGRGTTFSIRLPLTLAIIDGMVVRVGAARFIVPTVALEQALRPLPAQVTTVQQRGELIQVRGRLIPLIQLGAMLGVGERVNPCGAMVVIASADGEAVGLVVDELLGQQQVVIKSLGDRFQGLQGVAGGAILGDGRVGLILEVAGLMTLNAKWRAPDNRPEGERDETGSQETLTQVDTEPASSLAAG